MSEPADRRSSEGKPRDEGAVRELARELDRLGRAGERGWLTMSAPLAPPERAFDAVPSATGVLWSRAGGGASAGVGAAAAFEADPRTAPAGAAALHEPFGALVSDVRPVSLDGTDPPPLRAFGGMTFFNSPKPSPLWRPLGRTLFVLPRALYRTDGERASLSVFFDPRDAEGGSERTLRGASDILARLARPAGGARPPRASRAPSGSDRARWCELVRDILTEIKEGRLEKAVLTRCLRVPLAAGSVAGPLASRLARPRDRTVVFAIRRGGVTFLGASPERLVAVRGTRVESDALAGTAAPASVVDAGDGPLASEKVREEHALVADSIRRRLAPFCRSLESDARPRLLRLEHAMHLHTPIVGGLDRPRHVLELALALHPTPAVGGSPEREATRWLLRHEPEPRGWFAAPFGWFDGDGNGELAVALRSGLLAERLALVYAGAGIVAGSDPDAEYDETALKMTPFLEALGVRA